MFIFRTIITDKFSTFLCLEDSGKASWKTDIILRKHIQNFLEKSRISKQSDITPQEENKIAYFFLDKVRGGETKNINIFKNHLSSYLQEACYWASREVYNRMDRRIVGSVSIADCFAWGNEEVSQPERLLKTYRIDGGSRITTYAKRRLTTIVGEKVNSYLKRKNAASDWGLLKGISRKKLEEILRKEGGFGEEEIKKHLLAWQCFKDNYSGIRRHGILQPPDYCQWQLITQQYNLAINQICQQPLFLTSPQIREKLETCVKLIRRSENPPNVSYEGISYSLGEEEGRGELSDFSGDLANLENPKSKHLEETLKKNFEALDKTSQAIFYLGLGLDLTQTQIVEVIGKIQPEIRQQYQLSRRIKKIKMHLIESARIGITAYENNPQCGEIKDIIPTLEEWLQEYVAHRIIDVATETYESLPEGEKEAIRNQYFSFVAKGGKKLDFDSPAFLQAFRQKLESLLLISLTIEGIDNHLLLPLEKFCNYYLNRRV